MGILRILLKEFYVKNDRANGFKGYEYFKRIITVKGAEWITDQIQDNLINPDVIKNHKQNFITGFGSQYLRLYYKGDKNKKIILRFSNHEEDRSISENSNYNIDMWSSSEREIKEHINEFIDIAIIYFNGLIKRERGEKLSREEMNIILAVHRGKIFHQPDSYVSLDIVNKKAYAKKKNNVRTPILRLP